MHNGANVTLVLEGENELHGDTNHPAIWVEPGCALTIEGTGALNAYAGSGTLSTGSAAIGSAYGTNTNFGDITIQSGTVYAEGSGGGAGIGGGYQLGTGSTSGNITITGGWVRAFGGKAAPAAARALAAVKTPIIRAQLPSAAAWCMPWAVMTIPSALARAAAV